MPCASSSSARSAGSPPPPRFQKEPPNHCQAHVEKALNAIDGVEAKVNLETKTATLTLSKDVSDDVLRGAVTEAGYEVVSIQ